jgi:hypothetical protein
MHPNDMLLVLSFGFNLIFLSLIVGQNRTIGKLNRELDKELEDKWESSQYVDDVELAGRAQRRTP